MEHTTGIYATGHSWIAWGNSSASLFGPRSDSGRSFLLLPMLVRWKTVIGSQDVECQIEKFVEKLVHGFRERTPYIPHRLLPTILGTFCSPLSRLLGRRPMRKRGLAG